MRAHGVRTSPTGLHPGDHLCWSYDGARGLQTAAARYLGEGATRGEQLLYVSRRDAGTMLADLARLEALAELREHGLLDLVSSPGLIDAEHPVAADDQVAFFMAATEAALRRGRTGLRVLTEVTDVVADAALRREHLRLEQLADASLAEGVPLTAMCAVDAQRLDAAAPEAWLDLEAVHGLGRAGTGRQPPFRLVATGPRRAAVVGSVDTFSADRLRRLLLTSPSLAGGVLDLAALDFVDAAGLHAVAGAVRRRRRAGDGFRLVGAAPLVVRMWSVLGYARYAGDLTREGRTA
jgi:anti-anti-sigma factor